MVIVAGLDLAAYQHHPSGVAVLSDNSVLFIGVKHSDPEIIGLIKSYKPRIIAIDSPLSHAQTYREVDILMKRRGYPVLPPGWKTMKPLVDRAIRIKKILEGNSIVVIETHPKSALKSSGCKNIDELLKNTNIMIGFKKKLTRDEADALIAAIVARFYVEGRAYVVAARDGIIYLMPRICGGRL